MRRLTKPRGVVIHHSATRDTDTISYDAIKKFHTEELGWDDIGYHYILEMVDGEPSLFTGRGLQYWGAHDTRYNDSVGICVVGNYDQNTLPEALRGLLIDLLLSLVIMYGWSADLYYRVYYHNESSTKTCPGINFPDKKEIIDELAEDINRLLS